MYPRLKSHSMCRSIACALLCAAAAGCGTTPPTSFYILNASQSPVPQESSASKASVGVGEIRVPAYLDRPQIVSRNGGNLLKVAEFEQWAEPLKDNVTRVLAQDIHARVPNDRVEIFPWRRSPGVDYQVTVEIRQFDTVWGESATLVAQWNILDRDGKVPLLTRSQEYREPILRADYATAVASMNRALARLSADIAGDLESVIP